MEITKNTKSYNKRRYGKPWIAKIDFADPKGSFAWGEWTGDHLNGGEGVLIIEAKPGDIIAIGQKDSRQPKNSAAAYYVISEEGEIVDLGDKGTAYKHYLETKKANPNPDIDTLRKERDTLITRIAAINKIIGDKE